MTPTLRTTLAAVAGYVAIRAAVLLLFTLVYLILGDTWSFEPASWKPMDEGVCINVAVGLAAAVLGGWVTQVIDPSGKGTFILIGAIAALGIGDAVLSGDISWDEAREVMSPTNLEAMQNAIQPVWLGQVNVVIGCVGAFVGGKLRRRMREQRNTNPVQGSGPPRTFYGGR